ncbi:MAG: G:T/U-mismatch repair DNA glycosylase, partial [Ulvibacter sp.]
LWPILDCLFELNLKFETTTEAIEQRKQFLIKNGIGIINLVSSARREKIDASDLGMQDVELCDMVSILQMHSKVDTLLFMGGNSKNGPEYFFRRHLKQYDLALSLVSNEVPRIHTFQLPKSSRTIKTVSLTAPSGAANRAVGSLDAYRKMKAEFPKKTTIDFRVEQYRPFF